MKFEEMINKVIQGDCLEVMKDIPDNAVDIVITSPPYNAKGDIGSGKSSKYIEYADNLNNDDYYKLIKGSLTELLRVTEHYVFYNFQILSGNKEVYQQIMHEFRNNIKEYFIWAKTFGQPAIQEGVVASQFEFIICFTDASKATTRRFEPHYWSNRQKGAKVVSNTLIMAPNTKNVFREHSATFSEWLPDYFIRNFSKEGDLVLDPFNGLGTTTMSAKNMNRRYIGIELTKEYCELADQRLRQETLI